MATLVTGESPNQKKAVSPSYILKGSEQIELASRQTQKLKSVIVMLIYEPITGHFFIMS
jgi:hypothetical protein